MKDLLLTTLISTAEADEPTETDITLVVGGFLVSGLVISAKKYMEHHPITKVFWETLEKARSEMPPPEEGEDTSPNFIHLRDAKFFTPGGNPIPQNQPIYWRGPLESVHGFSFGVLSVEIR
jgi:hypothetical protein